MKGTVETVPNKVLCRSLIWHASMNYLITPKITQNVCKLGRQLEFLGDA